MIKSQSISLSHIVAQNDGNIVSDMGGEKVMLSVHNGKYYNLGETGGVIWDSIKKPIVVKELIAALISVYAIEQTECEEQVISFLGLLYEEGLIQLEDGISS